MFQAKFLRWAAAAALLLILLACGEEVVPVDDPPMINLTAPDGGEAIQPGGTVDITWTASDDNMVAGVDLSYTADGVTETAIVADQTGTSYTWTVPNQDLYGVRVKAVATDNAGQTASDESAGIFAVVAHSARGYVTSSVCQNCHQTNYDALFQSGHPYKLNKVENSMPPTYPFSAVPTPPEGFTWDDITYVIGGYGWKARFMNSLGYILVTGLENVPTQLNLERPDLGGGLDTVWVNYHASDTQPKPYTCGSCHTTGWLTTAENGGVNQDGLEGIAGTWEETGITCEQCHNPGAGVGGLAHVVSQTAADINIPTTAEKCGECHFRDTNHNVLASGGFIRHHEQYDEMLQAGKAAFACSDCHNPHVGVRYGNAALGGIQQSCEDCHTGVTINHLPGPECEDCHMARASKSARAVHNYEGDVRTHIFKIQTEAWPKDSMFFVDPGTGATHTRGFITLDFACYSCHNDGAMPPVGGSNSAKTLAELSARAMGIHN